MSLYGKSILKENAEDISNMDLTPFIELAAWDDITRADSKSINEFASSEIANVLLEKQVLNKGTLMRLSKEDDEKRRIVLTCYRLAKAANDPDWRKMVMYNQKKKEHRAKIIEKYGSKAEKIAKASQKEYIKRAKKEEA